MEAFISFIVKHLVDNPDAVKVTTSEEESGRVVYNLEVGPGDLGQVIGKEGKTINGLRTLLFAASARHGKRVGLELVDPGRVRKPSSPE